MDAYLQAYLETWGFMGSVLVAIASLFIICSTILVQRRGNK